MSVHISPPAKPKLEPFVDAVLRMLWQLVGAYVYLVLLAKHDRPRRPVPAHPAADRLQLPERSLSLAAHA